MTGRLVLLVVIIFITNAKGLNDRTGLNPQATSIDNQKTKRLEWDQMGRMKVDSFAEPKRWCGRGIEGSLVTRFVDSLLMTRGLNGKMDPDGILEHPIRGRMDFTCRSMTLLGTNVNAREKS